MGVSAAKTRDSGSIGELPLDMAEAPALTAAIRASGSLAAHAIEHLEQPALARVGLPQLRDVALPFVRSAEPGQQVVELVQEANGNLVGPGLRERDLPLGELLPDRVAC